MLISLLKRSFSNLWVHDRCWRNNTSSHCPRDRWSLHTTFTTSPAINNSHLSRPSRPAASRTASRTDANECLRRKIPCSSSIRSEFNFSPRISSTT
jgi:hypothetical protein